MSKISKSEKFAHGNFLEYTRSLLHYYIIDGLKSILDTYLYKSFSKLFSQYFHKVGNFESQNIFIGILEAYAISKVQKCI